MNRKPLLFILAPLALAGCAKTNLLYDENKYNSVDFDENYYLEWEDIKELNVVHEDTYYKTPFIEDDEDYQVLPGQYWGGVHEKQFGYQNNLSKQEKKFSYGVTSKLFDGRVRCEGLYEKSRVQLDRSGFAMYFPKTLVRVKHLALSCKGFTNYYKYNEPSYGGEKLSFDLHWSFYIHRENKQYDKVTYHMLNVMLRTDNGGNSVYVAFEPSISEYFDELSGAVAMSLEWECNDPYLDSRSTPATDDYTNKEKRHLALMLYEVFLRDSLWNK